MLGLHSAGMGIRFPPKQIQAGTKTLSCEGGPVDRTSSNKQEGGCACLRGTSGSFMDRGLAAEDQTLLVAKNA